MGVRWPLTRGGDAGARHGPKRSRPASRVAVTEMLVYENSPGEEITVECSPDTTRIAGLGRHGCMMPMSWRGQRTFSIPLARCTRDAWQKAGYHRPRAWEKKSYLEADRHHSERETVRGATRTKEMVFLRRNVTIDS